MDRRPSSADSASPEAETPQYHSHPLANGAPPAWASGWGEDHFGPFVEISIKPYDGGKLVVQRLRWIPPGEFTMGSPEDEPGRDDDEGPQHRVKLTQGYWLFDTPVTQALWLSVTAENPSEFQSSNRPVENISFDDVKKFLTVINERHPGLELALPTEAQWEYACRAGVEHATYAGPIDIKGINNAPVLNDIAWYGGNSSDGFELDHGEDCSEWEEKAIEGEQAGSHPVAKKSANKWGLYDMLGNVWEWCADDMRDYKNDDITDPNDMEASARVVRGGSWGGYARRVRAAFRILREPGGRFNDLGFRCLRVQGGKKGGSLE